MAKTKDQKKEVVKILAKVVKDAKSVVFVNFDKLQVAEETKLRRALGDSGNRYQVVKKTLLTKAFEGSGITGELAEMPGMIGIATGEDLIAPAREVYAFQKDHKDNVKIVGGVFDGRFVGMEEMMTIATIPPLEALQAMFANIINSPLQRFAVVLGEVAKSK
jgi:large subunit ribosomal protein L10